MRAEQASGQVTHRADVRSAGFGVTVPGGHGTQYGIPVPTLGPEDDVDGFVAARAAEGSDWIKILLEGRMPTLSEAQVAAAAAAARRRRLLAIAHVGTADEAASAVRAGCDGLAHAFVDRPADPALAPAMAAASAFVIPTLTVLESSTGRSEAASLLDHPFVAAHLPPPDARNLRLTFPPSAGALNHGLATVRAMRDAGVPVLCGSDAPNPGTAFGASVHRELELLVRAGSTPVEALAAATSNPARVFGLADRGRVAPGTRADLLLVDGDPTVDITATRAVSGVWKAGVPVDLEADAREVAAAWRRADQLAAAPAPAGSAAGRVADFEDGLASRFGAGWVPLTDAVVGGTSTVDLEVVGPGADGTARSLEVRGVRADGAMVWAGAELLVGEVPFAPANLSAWRGLVFSCRGDGGPILVSGFTPASAAPSGVCSVPTGEGWQRHRVPFGRLGTDGSDLVAVLFGAGGGPGPFRFQIDEVALYT